MGTNTPASDSGIYSREDIDAKKLRKPRPSNKPENASKPVAEGPQRERRPERKSAKEALVQALEKALVGIRQTREDARTLGVIGMESESLEDSEAGDFIVKENDEIHAPIRSLVKKVREFVREVQEHVNNNDIQLVAWLDQIRRLEENVDATSGDFVSAVVPKNKETFELIPGENTAEDPKIYPEIQKIADRLKGVLRLIKNALRGRD